MFHDLLPGFAMQMRGHPHFLVSIKGLRYNTNEYNEAGFFPYKISTSPPRLPSNFA